MYQNIRLNAEYAEVSSLYCYGRSFAGHCAWIGAAYYTVLTQQFAQSLINNHLSLKSLLHVSVSTKSFIREMYTETYRYSKFCQRCAYVELKCSIVN